MRTRIAILIAAAILAIAAASATASPLFTSSFDVNYNPNRAGALGVPDLHMTWSDPGELGGRPKQIKTIRIGFAKGSKIDTKALTECKATDLQVRALGRNACPRSSRLGFAHSTVTGNTIPPSNTNVTFFNAPKQIIVLVELNGSKLANYRDDIEGSVVTVHLALPSGLSLLRLDAFIKQHTRGHGKRRRVYFRNPKTCPPSGTWTSTVTFTYLDGSSDQHADTAPCTGG